MLYDVILRTLPYRLSSGHSTAFGRHADSNAQHSSINTTDSHKLLKFVLWLAFTLLLFLVPRADTTSANKENLNTPTKKASTSWTTPVAANSISVDFLRPNQSIVSHGIDTQDLKVVLSGEQTAEAGAVHKSALGVRSNLPADWRQGLRLDYVHPRVTLVSSCVEPMIPDPVGEAHDSISSFSSSSRIHYPATGLDEDIVMPSQSSAEIGAQSSQAAIEGNNEDAVVNITAAVRPTIESEQTFRADSSQETQVQFTEAETQTQMKTVAQMGERDTTAPCDCGSKVTAHGLPSCRYADQVHL